VRSASTRMATWRRLGQYRHGPTAITVGSGSVWVTKSVDGTVTRIDPAASTVAATIPAGDGTGAIALGGGGTELHDSPPGGFGCTDLITRKRRRTATRRAHLTRLSYRLPTGFPPPSTDCQPAAARESWIAGKARWSPVFKDRSSAISWDGQEARAERATKALRHEGPSFAEVATEWWGLVEAGTYARRRGRAKKLARSTVADYRGVLFGPARGRNDRPDADAFALIDRCGRRPVATLDDAYWQSFVDELCARVSRTRGSRPIWL
jgi:hypothetical protein